MKRFLPKFSRSTICYGAILCLCFAVIMLSAAAHPLHPWPETLPIISFAEDWQTADGQTVDLTNLTELDAGETTVTKTLPEEISDGIALNFDSHNVLFTLTVDGHASYHFYLGGNITGKGYGDSFHSIPLSPQDAGRAVTLTLIPIYPNNISSAFRSMAICPSPDYFHRLIREHGFSFGLSVLIAFLGFAILLLQLGSDTDGTQGGMSLPALGISAIIFGAWASLETIVPQFIFGHPELLRPLDYLLLPFAEYPLIVFVNSMSVKKRQLYSWLALGISTVAITLTFAWHFLFDADMHDLSFLSASYGLCLLLILAMILEDRRASREQGVHAKLHLAHIGLLVFLGCMLFDLAIYLILGKAFGDNGFFTRIGLALLMIFLFIDTMRRLSIRQRNVQRDRFINEFLHYSLSAKSPEQIIGQMLDFLGREMDADRVYIFEEGATGYFANTYEWCREGVAPQKDVLQRVPFTGLLDTWFEDFGKFDYVIVDDLHAYREVSEPMYDLLLQLNIDTLVSGPLIIDGDYIGFFGVDNPSKKSIENVTYSIRLIEYFMAVMLRQRNNQRLLRQYSYRDQMTGAMNRRALEEFTNDELASPTSLGVLMCDINGLKRANDQQGHEAGDQMIRDVASCLTEVFGAERVFRMGGDEFLAIGITGKQTVFETNVRTLRLLLTAKGRSASLGFAFGDTGDTAFEEMQKEADSKMYADKRAYYDSHPDRRRRE